MSTDSKSTPNIIEKFRQMPYNDRLQILFLICIVLAIPVAVKLFYQTVYNRSLAQTAKVSIEAESGQLTGAANTGTDVNASGGKFVQFSGAGPGGGGTGGGGTGGGPTFQPSAPYYAAFFYPWYQNPDTDNLWSDWSDNGHSPPQNWFSNYLPDPLPATFDPAEELYSSSNDQIIYWQLQKMAEAHIAVGISSWWGQGHKTDNAFKHIITDVMKRPDNPYPNFRWAIYYEKQGFAAVPQSEITGDLTYIKNNYTNQPAYLKINGKPVIFVYDAAHSGSTPTQDMTIWKNANSSLGNAFYINMKVDALKAGAAANTFDNWHEYAPALREGQTGNYYYFVSPGFWKDGNPVRLCRNLNGSPSTTCGSDNTGKSVESFQAAVSKMVAANTTWKLIETWNEWGEGTSVEPGDQVKQSTTGPADIDPNGVPFQNSYVDVLNKSLPPLQAGTGTGGVQPTDAPTAAAGTPVPISPVPTTSAGGDPVVAAAGDMVCGAGSGGASCKQMDTVNLIKQMNPTAVLVLGDSQYETGATSDFQKYYDPSWGQLNSKVHPAIGNHEYGTSGGTGYYNYFNGHGVTTDISGQKGKGYYDFKLGTWWLYALNSNCSQAGGCNAGSPQEKWLKAELAAHANDGKCQVIYMHHPYLSSDTRNYDYYALQHDLWQDFYSAGGDLDLVGHSHFYERFDPMNVARAGDPNGIQEIIAGTGGRNTYGFGTVKPNSVKRIASTFGALKLTLHPAGYDWQFVDTKGNVLDSGSRQCH